MNNKKTDDQNKSAELYPRLNINFLKLGIHYRRKFPTTQRYIIYNPVLIEKLLTTAGSLEVGK